MKHVNLSFRLVQLSAGGGDRFSSAPSGQLEDTEGCVDSQQLGASQLGRCCSRCPGSYLCSCKDLYLNMSCDAYV